jgi:AAA15 family ATPase/GTPase
LGGEPWKETIKTILANRFQEDVIFENPDNQPFKDFFYNQNEDKNIEIIINEDIVKVSSNYYFEDKSDGVTTKIINRAALIVDAFKNNKEIKQFEYKTLSNGEKGETNFMVREFVSRPKIKTDFFSTNNNQRNIAKNFEKIVDEEKEYYLLKAFQTIEKDIVKLVFSNNRLLLKREKGKLMPINLFGDAMNKVCGWVLSIIGGEKKILLIDEIENGIHHTNQQKFWTMLFNLAKEFDIQIFATSHSAEMIKAFQEVAKQKSEDCKAMYFELSRNQDTNKIITNKLNIDLLEYEITKNQPFRGE